MAGKDLHLRSRRQWGRYCCRQRHLRIERQGLRDAAVQRTERRSLTRLSAGCRLGGARKLSDRDWRNAPVPPGLLPGGNPAKGNESAGYSGNYGWRIRVGELVVKCAASKRRESLRELDRK